MFLNLWSPSGRHDKAMQDKAAFAPTSPPRPPLSPITQIPIFNKMKRKHGESSPSSPLLNAPPSKKRLETMSHVELPAFGSQSVNQSAAKSSEESAAPSTSSQTSHGISLGKTQSSMQELAAMSSPVTPTDPPLQGISPDQGSRKPDSRKPRQPVSKAVLRQTIESQFALEILLKHKELRLIDQELGKCQVALEQLRRCQVIPYPALSWSTENALNVADGSGSSHANRATNAPPWGIAEGPYTRHYQRWLLQDSAFDESFVDIQAPRSGSKTLPERATRGSKSEKSPIASISRSQRGTSTRLKALPHGYPETKEEKGPMIVKRSSDGHMVKLVCLDCRRSNFNSAQGFINHCRIAHARQFLSHDAAIEASGEEIDAETDVVAEPSGGRATASAGLVHPLIRSAHLIRSTTSESTPAATPSSRKKKKAIAGDEKPSPSTATPEILSQPPETPSTLPEPRMAEVNKAPHQLFQPSPQTPYLSAMLARIGKGGNLNDIVNDAKTRPEISFDDLSDSEDDVEEEETSQDAAVIHSRSTRGILRGGRLPSPVNTAHTTSRQTASGCDGSVDTPPGPEILSTTPQHPPYPSPFSLGHHDETQSSMLDIQTPLNLSPNTTDPHPAPSLVSDDGDHETTHTDSEGACSGDEDESAHHYLDTEVMEHDSMDLEGAAQLRLESSNHKQNHPSHPSPTAARRPRVSPAYRSEPDKDEGRDGETHVSFASPPRSQRRSSMRTNVSPKQ